MIAESKVVPIDDLLWTATRYSDVLKIDRRVVAQALESAPAQTKAGRKVWHVRDGMRAIFSHPSVRTSSSTAEDPESLPPKDRLDWFRSERERLKLESEQQSLIPAIEVESTMARLCKAIAQTLDTLPDVVERDCALPGEAVAVMQRVINEARESLYQHISESMTDGDSSSDST